MREQETTAISIDHQPTLRNSEREPMHVSAVLFDLDDTLLVRRPSLLRFAEAFTKDYSSHLDVDHVNAESVNQALVTADGGGYRARDEVFAELLDVLPWHTYPDIAHLRIYWQQMFPRCATPTEGLDKLLMQLRHAGLRLGIITNGGSAVQQLKIDALGIRKHMESIVVSESVGVSKPDVRIFQRGLTELELAPAEVLYVGDHPVNDVLGASAAGMTSIWLKGTYAWPTEHKEPEFQLERIDDLVELLEQRFGQTTQKTKQE